MKIHNARMREVNQVREILGDFFFFFFYRSKACITNLIFNTLA